MLRRVFALIIKELQSILRDKKSRHVLFIPPIIQLLIFTYAATLDVKNVSLAVCNNDRGSKSIEVVERLSGSPIFAHIHFFDRLKDAEDSLLLQKVSAVVHFDSRFSKDISQKKQSQIQILLDGRKSNSTQVVLGYIQRVIDQYNADIIIQEKEIQSPSHLVPRNWFNSNLIYPWFTVPGLVAILGMITSLTATSLSVAKEREIGTFDQLLVSPLTPFEIILGKSIPGVIIGLFEASIILFAGVFIFHIPFTGSIWAFYTNLTVFVISIVGIGLFLSSISKTQQQAFMKVFFFISPAIILSGFATPIANMPDWLQKITVINPLKYFLIVSRGCFLKEMGFVETVKYTLPMVWIGLFTLTSAAFFFRRKLD